MVDKKKTMSELIDNIFIIKKRLLHETINMKDQINHYDDCCTTGIIVLINEFLDLCLLAMNNTLCLPRMEDYPNKERRERHDRLQNDIQDVINSLINFMAQEMASREEFDRAFEEAERKEFNQE